MKSHTAKAKHLDFHVSFTEEQQREGGIRLSNKLHP
jgi:hypothetical protein